MGTQKMPTMIFVDNSAPYTIGFQITRRNLHYAPPGKWRIARFSTAFFPTNGLGYYSDIYIRKFLRHWKSRFLLHKKRRLEKYNSILSLQKATPMIDDVIRYTSEFL